MIPYLLPEIPGELFYSRIVRTMKLCTGTLSAEFIGTSLLGDRYRRLGVRLPLHGRQLLNQIPQVHEVTASDLMRGSLFPTVAPFIDPAQRARLVNECIENPSPQVARWFFVKRANHSRCLKFCPKCAQDDHVHGRPMHWRTAHQHPSSAACSHHGILLMPAPDAVLGKDSLHDPGIHIVPATGESRPAGAADLIIAHDLRWLLEENAMNPGRTRMQAALRTAIRQVPRYRSRYGYVNGVKLLADLQAFIGSPDASNRSSLLAHFTLTSIGRTMSRCKNVPAFYEYSLLSALIGLSLPELMARAAALTEG